MFLCETLEEAQQKHAELMDVLKNNGGLYIGKKAKQKNALCQKSSHQTLIYADGDILTVVVTGVLQRIGKSGYFLYGFGLVSSRTTPAASQTKMLTIMKKFAYEIIYFSSFVQE